MRFPPGYSMADVGMPPPLSAKDKSSFAYLTIKDRLPVILSKIADTVYRKKGDIRDKHGEEGTEDLKNIAGCISKLRNEVQTNKPVIPLQDDRTDVLIWNNYLQEVTEREGVAPKWFESPWLYVECYMYRRVQEAVEKCKVLKELDVFEDQKHKAFVDSQNAILSLIEYLHQVTDKLKSSKDEYKKDMFAEFIQVALWGNKCDLSISAAQENAQTTLLHEQLEHLYPNILVDNTDQVWQCLQGTAQSQSNGAQGQAGRVDIVLDNAGFELITDMCFAHFLLSAGLATSIYFHVKSFPWFVSDVTKEDFNWTMQMLCASNSIWTSKIASQWMQYLQEKSWNIVEDEFWTTSFTFNEMKSRSAPLYQELEKSKLIFFKGDLNYRKLVGDLAWKHTTFFPDSLRGFKPAPLCSLRTSKSDTIVGLQDGQADEMQAKDHKWMVNGNWAVISFAS